MPNEDFAPDTGAHGTLTGPVPRKTRRTKLPPIEPGSVFVHLTAVRLVGADKWGDSIWLCRCSCGKETETKANKLKRGETKSCGCKKGQWCAEANTTHGASARGKMTVEYHTWQGMIDRCENPNYSQYADWGGRGIKVCAEWRHNFPAFLAHIGPRPGPNYTIDRTNNDLDYQPGNVQWKTRTDQNRNKRSNRWVTHNGERMLASEWAERTGICEGTIVQRLAAGWSVAHALTAPKRTRLSTYAGTADPHTDASFEADFPQEPSDFETAQQETP
jgi:hypothetical protein